jgi:hypothetical protein
MICTTPDVRTIIAWPAGNSWDLSSAVMDRARGAADQQLGPNKPSVRSTPTPHSDTALLSPCCRQQLCVLHAAKAFAYTPPSNDALQATAGT